MIVIRCSGNTAKVEKNERITSGSQKIYTVKFIFDDVWDGLGKTATFKTKNKEIINQVLDVDNTCIIPAEILTDPTPALYAGIRGFGEDGEVRPTVYAKVGEIEQGAEPGVNVEEPTPTLEEQLLAVVGNTLNIAAADRAAAHQSALDASESAGKAESEATSAKETQEAITLLKDEVVEKHQDTLENADAAEQSALNAEASATAAAHSADLADNDASVSAQALRDLLNMIDEDIPMLVGGKIQMKNIPIEARFDQVEIPSEEYLTQLTLAQVQPGDFAYVTSIVEGEKTLVKSWRLVGETPSVRSNWIVDGTSYASRAAHASLSDNAANAAMINNHRLVVMSEDEFNHAVHNADTLYVVYEV